MAKVIHATHAWGGERWCGKVRLGVTTFVGMDIVSDTGYSLSVKDAKRMIAELVEAVNEVEAREGNK